MKSDYYAVLGIAKDASSTEIKSAYRRMAREWHPDFHLENKMDAEAKMRDINEAYAVLGNGENRAKYDRFGASHFKIEMDREMSEREKVGALFTLFHYKMQRSTFTTRINIARHNIKLTETWNNASNFAMGFGFLSALCVPETFQEGDYNRGILQIVFSAMVGGGGCFLKWYSPHCRMKYEKIKTEYETATRDLDAVIDNLESKL